MIRAIGFCLLLSVAACSHQRLQGRIVTRVNVDESGRVVSLERCDLVTTTGNKSTDVEMNGCRLEPPDRAALVLAGVGVSGEGHP